MRTSGCLPSQSREESVIEEMGWHNSFFITTMLPKLYQRSNSFQRYACNDPKIFHWAPAFKGSTLSIAATGSQTSTMRTYGGETTVSHQSGEKILLCIRDQLLTLICLYQIKMQRKLQSLMFLKHKTINQQKVYSEKKSTNWPTVNYDTMNTYKKMHYKGLRVKISTFMVII